MMEQNSDENLRSKSKQPFAQKNYFFLLRPTSYLVSLRITGMQY